MTETWTIGEIGQLAAIGLVLGLQAVKLAVGEASPTMLHAHLTIFGVGWALAVMSSRSSRLTTQHVKSIAASEVDEFNAQ